MTTNNSAVLDAGRFDFEDGGTYCGGWEDGKAHGFGVCTGPKGMGEFSGAWEFGYEISGIYLWPSGNCYQGEWMSGKRHGIGVEKKQRFIYKGEWSQGFKGRYGIRVSELSGAKYEGTWANGLQDGYGSETYSDGGTYVGQMTQGMRNGYGIRTSVPYGTASRYRSKDVKDSLTSLRSEDDEERVQRERDRKFDENRGGFVLRAKSDINEDSINPSGGIVSTALNGFFRRRRNSLGHSQDRRISLRKTIMNKLTKQKSANDINDVTSHRSMTPAPTPSTRSANNNNKKSSFRSMSSNASVDSRTSNRTAPPGVGGLSSPGAPLMDDGEHSFISQDEITDNNCVEVYMGEWKQDKRTGYGIAERSDGLKYEGEWFNNKKNGYGVTTFKDGTKEEGKYKNNVLITDKKKAKLMLIRSSKQREKVDYAVNAALKAAQTAQQRAAIALGRAINARAKAHLAELAAKQARGNSEVARIKAREVAPDFVQPGELKKPPEIQLDVDKAPLNSQLMLDPNSANNNLSPQAYRRTPSRPPLMNLNQRGNQNSLSLDSASSPYNAIQSQQQNWALSQAQQIQIPAYTSMSQQQSPAIYTNSTQPNLGIPTSTPIKFQLQQSPDYNQYLTSNNQFYHPDVQKLPNDILGSNNLDPQLYPPYLQQQQQQYFRQQNSFNYEDANNLDPRLLQQQQSPNFYLNGENIDDNQSSNFQRNTAKRQTLKRAQRVMDGSNDDMHQQQQQAMEIHENNSRQKSQQREESSKRDDIQPINRASVLPRRKSLPSIVKNQKFKEDEVAHSSSQLHKNQPETFIIENGIRKRITETSNTSILNEDAANLKKFDKALDKASHLPQSTINNDYDTSPKLPRKILIESITSLNAPDSSKTSAKRVSMPSIPAHMASKYANKVMSREEANKLSSQRREELRNYAKLMETSSLARFKAAFPDLVKRNRVLVAILIFNISLAIWFLNLLR